MTNREDHNHFCGTCNNDGKEKANFESLKRFMYDNVLDLGGRYEGRRWTEKEIGRGGGCLNPQALQNK